MLIIQKQYFLSDYIFEGLDADSRRRHDLVVHRSVRRRGLRRAWQKVLKYLAVKGAPIAPTHFFERSYVEEIVDKARNHQSILLFDIQNLKDIKLMRRIFPDHRMSVFLWNPAHTFCRNRFSKRDYINSVGRRRVTVATFDAADAADYGFTPVRQPYRRVDDGPDDGPAAGDVFFIGRDKGRSHKLAAIAALLGKALRLTLYIQRDKHTKPLPELAAYYHDAPLDYRSTLRQICRHKAYLEVMQKDQRGTTMRPLEALFRGRKVLTDNPLMIDSDLYHPSRMLLLTPSTTLADVERFLQLTFEPLDPQVVASHDINVWLRQFE